VSVLQRYVFGELTKVFVAAFLVTALVLTMGGTLKYVEGHYAGLGMLVRVMPRIVAEVLPYIFPVAILLATTMVYGRMSADNEIVAVRAAGMLLWRIVAPALLLGLVASGVSLYLADWYIPPSRVRIQAMIARYLPEWLDHRLSRTHMTLGRWSIVHHGKQGSVLEDVTITQYDKDGQAKSRISADEGRFYVDQQRGVLHFDFYNASGWGLSPDDVGGTGSGKFDELSLPVQLSQISRDDRDIKDMTTAELWGYSGLLEGEDRREALAEVFRRGALGVACAVFVFVGVPLGIRTRSGHLLSAFALACLPVLVLYFPLLIIAKSLAEAGKVPAGPALWAANVVVLLLGTVLMAVEFRR